MRWARSVASTSMSIVPGYATSTGGGTAARAVEAANGDDSARATASDRLARYERRMRRFLRFSGQSPSSPGLGRSSPCHWAWWRGGTGKRKVRSEEHTSELQSLMRISYAVFCLKKKIT